jgi:hypothetical protein
MKNEALKLALEALEVANSCVDGYYISKGKTHLPEIELAITAIKEALAESEPNYKKALEVWLDKTEWVQETVKPHELGMHRADVLKQRIEATLAQPEQDVGITRYADISVGKIIHNSPPPQRTWEKFCDSNCVWTDHHPDCKLAQQEPVAYINVEQRKLEWAKYMSWDTPTVVNLPKIPLYTTPPQRTWVGLTDEDRFELAKAQYGWEDLLFAAEAKLKAKNETH